MSIEVLKFGGTSVKSVARINHVAKIIANSKAEKKIVVLSAMGDTTDYLLRLAKQCAQVPDKRELDLLLSTGEQVSVSLLAIKLRELGINAKAYTGHQLGIGTDSSHTEARIIDIDSKKLKDKLEKCDVLIAAGFQGIDKNGEITTLGRGGSDTTAVAIAACVNASTCEIYTDVDGIYTADPNTVRKAKVLSEISFEQATELAYAGAQVIHPRAVELASQFDIRVRVKNTFKPDSTGTLIKKEEEMEKVCQSYNIALSQKEACIRLNRLEDNCPALELLQEVAEKNDLVIYSVAESVADLTEDGIDSHSIAPNKRCLEAHVGYKDIDQLKLAASILKDLTQTKQCSIDIDLAKLSIIGKALSKDTLSSLIKVLKEAKIAPRKIEFSDTKISCLIDSLQGAFASNLIHDTLNPDQPVKRTRKVSVA